MIEKEKIYTLSQPIKGWPVEDADTLEEAVAVIFGSPYWDIPDDCYKVLDKNETYSLLAVYKDKRTSMDKRYLAVNAKLSDLLLESDKSCS